MATGSTMLDRVIPAPRAWTARTLGAEDGLVRLPEEAIGELRAALDFLARNPLPTILLSHEDFELPACRAAMAEARAQLVDGVGYVILDRLPLDEWTLEAGTAAYWLLATAVARPVAQSWDAKMIYDVRDSGRALGPEVRPDITNAEQNFHTDNSYNLCPPDYVALLCVRPARSGGVSGVVSFEAVHNILLERDPVALRRLYEPFVFNRQREHAPDEARVVEHPLFSVEDGALRGRLSLRQVVVGYEVAGREIDAEGARALDALERTMMDPELCKTFVFERGQVQIVNNLRVGHRRTAFADFPEPERRRHLVRLWLRDRGRRSYHG